MTTLRIGEYDSLGAVPAYWHLKQELRQDWWTFVPGTIPELDRALERDEIEVSLVSPLLIASAPADYLALPGLGYGARRHTRDMFLFSDMLLDDMDEMTISLPDESTAANLIQIITGHFLQFQNQFITGWGDADAFLLVGDPALRERQLGRYAYVYDVGDLWRHYTKSAMAYYLWAVKRDTLRRKREAVLDFYRSLRRGLTLHQDDWALTASRVQGYDWVRNPKTITQLWADVNHELSEEHLKGLEKYFVECMELGLIDEPPEIQYLEA